MINILWIAVICVIIIDQTDAIDNLKTLFSRILTKGIISTSEYSLKPLDCSLCASWWLNLIYIIVTGNLTIFNVALILALAILTPVINDIINLIINIITKLIRLIDDTIE